MADLSRDMALLGDLLRRRGWRLACAESCTGGLLSGALTDVPGSSEWFAGAVVAYANAVKTRLLSVPRAVLLEHGAVSRETVLAMAAGVRSALGAEAGLAVSGIAGPAGGSPDKPVGLVWLAFDLAGRAEAEEHRFAGGRAEVRRAAVAAAVNGLLARLRAG
jgi:nicotinamide-nucleotide amidase